MDNQTIIANAALAAKILNFDITDYPVRAQGTADGVQYGAEVVTVLADTDYELLLYKTFDRFSRLKGGLVWVEYNIEIQLKAGNTSADVRWKLQARDKGGTWVDMCAEQIETDINTTYVDKAIKGYLDIKTNITKVPFEIRLIFQSNEAAPGIATGQVKNTTFIRVIGEAR